MLSDKAFAFAFDLDFIHFVDPILPAKDITAEELSAFIKKPKSNYKDKIAETFRLRATMLSQKQPSYPYPVIDQTYEEKYKALDAANQRQAEQIHALTIKLQNAEQTTIAFKEMNDELRTEYSQVHKELLQEEKNVTELHSVLNAAHTALEEKTREVVELKSANVQHSERIIALETALDAEITKNKALDASNALYLQQIAEYTERLQEEEKEIDYTTHIIDYEDEITQLMHSLRASLPDKHLITKNIFTDFGDEIERAIEDDFPEEPLYIYSNFIVVYHLPNTRHKEYEIHGYMYVITHKYIYELCAFQNGKPMRHLAVMKGNLFTIHTSGTYVRNQPTIGFAPIGFTPYQINIESFPYVDAYIKHSKRFIGTASKGSMEVGKLYKMLSVARDRLINLCCHVPS
jgi:hypothetical protein